MGFSTHGLLSSHFSVPRSFRRARHYRKRFFACHANNPKLQRVVLASSTGKCKIAAMSKLRLNPAESSAASDAALRHFAVLGLTCGLISCATPQPPRISATGTLPSGTDAGFMLVDGGVNEAWLSAAALTRCLESKGMQAAAAPHFFVQYAVAIRPVISRLQVGKEAAGSAVTAPAGGKQKGERIITKVIVDRLSDGRRVYELSIDADYKQRRSTPANRAAQLCSAIDSKSP
jgi:hypothetical protein